MLNSRAMVLTLAGLATFFLAGCEEEGIRRYQVPKVAKPLTYTLPEGWREMQVSERAASFGQVARLNAGDVEITVSSGPGGGLLPNINRWRDQIGLPPIEPRQLQDELRAIPVGGSPGQHVELIGPESAGAKRQAILGVIVSRAGKNWYFKLQGPVEAARSAEAAFMKFLKSVQFGGGAGGD